MDTPVCPCGVFALCGLLPLSSSPDLDPGLSPLRRRRPRWLAVRGREDWSCIGSCCRLLCFSNKVELGFLAVLLLVFFFVGCCGRGVGWSCPQIRGVLRGSGVFPAGDGFLKPADDGSPLDPKWMLTMASMATPFAGCGGYGQSGDEFGDGLGCGCCPCLNPKLMQLIPEAGRLDVESGACTGDVEQASVTTGPMRRLVHTWSLKRCAEDFEAKVHYQAYGQLPRHRKATDSFKSGELCFGAIMEILSQSNHVMTWLFRAQRKCSILGLDMVLQILHMRVSRCSAQFENAMPGWCWNDSRGNLMLDTLGFLCCVFHQISEENSSLKNISNCYIVTLVLLQHHRWWRPCACSLVSTSSSSQLHCYWPACGALYLVEAVGHDEYAVLLFGTCWRRVRASLLRFPRFNSQEPPGLSSVMAHLDLQLIPYLIGIYQCDFWLSR